MTAASESHRGIATGACSAPTWTCARPASSVSHTFAAGDGLHCNEGQQHCHEALFPFIYYSNIKLDTMQLMYYSSKFLTHLIIRSVFIEWFCSSCSGGAKPEGHEDDHEMVNMEYACDHCQGLIVGSRINCNVCEDFDLCFGCYNAKKYPDR